MINCPKCGTANQDTSRVCSNCGTTLQAPGGRRCPMCGKMNPPTNAKCDSCGARLVPLTASASQQPTSGPSRASAAETTAVKKAAPPPPPPQQPAPGSSDDWLSSLRGTLSEAPAPEENIPDWLRGEPSAESEAGPPAFDLAARLGGTEAPQAEVPEWLSRLAPADRSPAAPTPAEEVPDWLKQISSTPAPTPPAPAAQAPEAPDWLQQLAPTPPSKATPVPPTPAAPAPAPAAQVPDWLKQPVPAPTARVTPAPAPTPKVAPAPAEEVPDWLKQPVPAPAARVTPAPAPTPAEAEIPDWLKPPGPSPVEAEIPDWLKEISPAPKLTAEPVPPTPAEAEAPRKARSEQPLPAPTAGVSVPPPLEEAELPDWLKSLEPTPTTLAPSAPSAPLPAYAEPQAAPGPEPEMPAWMRDLTPATPSEVVPTGPALVVEPAPEPAEAPQWLKEIGSQPAPAEALAELPDWLKELQPQAPSEQPVPPIAEAPALAEEAAPEPTGEMPTWLKELGPAEAPVAPQAVFTGLPAPAPAPSPAAAGGLVAAQLPAWLQKLAPTGVAPKEAEKEEPVETEGILAGVRGPLTAATIVTQQATGEPHPLHPEIPAIDLSRAGALQELLARGPAVVVRREVESRAQKLWSNTQRWTVFLVLMVLAFVPLWQEQLVYDLGLVRAPQLQTRPAANAVYQDIDNLKPGSLVFVAFDYDATQSSEMDTQARVLLRHLAARKANLKVASLYPSGPAVAQTVIDGVNATLPITDRIRVENHGYVPGQDMAVTFIQGEAISASLVIELAATPDTLRWWAEQMTAAAQQGKATPPLLAGVSAAAEPMSLPYYHSQQVKGMLAGVPDAVAYRLELQNKKVAQEDKDSPAHVLAPLASIGVANAALAVLMVAGGLIQLVAGGGKRR